MIDFVKPNRLTDDEIRQRMLDAANNAIVSPHVYRANIEDFKDIEPFEREHWQELIANPQTNRREFKQWLVDKTDLSMWDINGLYRGLFWGIGNEVQS